MMKPVLQWIERVNDYHNLKPVRILDVGSYDDKYGNMLRQLFGGAKYTGIDLRPGSNVDLVMCAYDICYQWASNTFDAVMCLNVLEHLKKPWIVLNNVNNVLQDKGLFYVSIPTIGFPKHDYPGDYWRATVQAVQEVIMDGYEIVDLTMDVSEFGKHPFINCVGRKNGG